MIISPDAVVLVRRENKVVYRDGDRVIKAFDASKPAADVFNEGVNLSRAEGAGVRVTNVIEVARVEGGPHAGCWALATRFVPGHTLAAQCAEDGGAVETCMRLLVQLQTETHAHRAPLLTRQKEKLGRMISSTKHLLDATTRYDLHVRVESMRSDLCVCHGDLVPSNVILGEDGQLYLCDWSHATAGIPEADAAMTYLLLSMEDSGLAELYLNCYCNQTDTEPDSVRYWLPVVAAAELSRGNVSHQEALKQHVVSTTKR